MLVKPMNTDDLLRQLEALLVQHEDQKQHRRNGTKSTNKPNTKSQAAAKRPA